jgi:hypothetical protein
MKFQRHCKRKSSKQFFRKLQSLLVVVSLSSILLIAVEALDFALGHAGDGSHSQVHRLVRSFRSGQVGAGEISFEVKYSGRKASAMSTSCPGEVGAMLKVLMKLVNLPNLLVVGKSGEAT